MLTEYNHMAHCMGYLDTFPLIFCCALKNLRVIFFPIRFMFGHLWIFTFGFHFCLSMFFRFTFQCLWKWAFQDLPNFTIAVFLSKLEQSVAFVIIPICCKFFQTCDASSQLEYCHLHLWDVYP